MNVEKTDDSVFLLYARLLRNIFEAEFLHFISKLLLPQQGGSAQAIEDLNYLSVELMELMKRIN